MILRRAAARYSAGRAYLEHLGATVTAAHVIVSDLSMPSMDGLELLARIRALPEEQASPTPAIALTGFATRENETAARRAGFATFIPKPADPLDVPREIERLAVTVLDAPIYHFSDAGAHGSLVHRRTIRTLRRAWRGPSHQGNLFAPVADT